MKTTICTSLAACLVTLSSASLGFAQNSDDSQPAAPQRTDYSQPVTLPEPMGTRWGQDLINIETARSLWLDNQNRAVTNFYQRGVSITRGRAEMEVERLKARSAQLTAKEQHQQVLDEHRRAAAERSQRQSLERLARLDLAHQITWPVALTDARFAKGRRMVEKFFSGQRSANVASSSEAVRVQGTLAEMRQQLRVINKEIGETKYAVSKRFLSDLEVGVQCSGQQAVAFNP